MDRPRDELAARGLIFSAAAFTTRRAMAYSCAAVSTGCSTETGSDAGKVFLRASSSAFSCRLRSRLPRWMVTCPCTRRCTPACADIAGALADGDPAAPIVFGDRDADRQRQAATCLSLYEYRDGRLAPFAANGPAARRSNRRVWIFRVRPGFAFSPPSHERVDARTFAATIERSTAPAFPHSEAAEALADVVGMHAYRRGLTTHLAGIEATGARLTIRLNRPVANLDARLAAPYFCALPKDTPAVPTGLQDPIPSAGPYYVAGGSGGAFVVLRRNPYYPLPNRAGFAAIGNSPECVFWLAAMRAMDISSMIFSTRIAFRIAWSYLKVNKERHSANVST